VTTDSIVSTVDNAGPATAPLISRDSERHGEATEVGPPRPRTFGFDVKRLNEEFALVLMGSKAVVFLEQPAAPIEDQKRVLTIEAFSAWFANRITQVAGPDGTIRSVTWAKAWLQSPSRRSYRGIEFYPDPNSKLGMSRTLLKMVKRSLPWLRYQLMRRRQAFVCLNCLIPLRSERQAQPEASGVVCKPSVYGSPSWLPAWPQRSSAGPSRPSANASRCG
jgi:hypothetical protein